MKKVVTLLGIVAVSGTLVCSTNKNRPDGFYLTIDCGDYVESKPIKLARKREACLPDKPLVDLSGIDSLSSLHLSDENLLSFQVILNNEAVSRFRRISNQLPSSTFAFVLNNEIFFTFKIQREKFNRQIEVVGNYRDKEIPALHDQLEKLLLIRFGE